MQNVDYWQPSVLTAVNSPVLQMSERGAVWLACLDGVQEVVSSNLTAPTKKNSNHFRFGNSCRIVIFYSFHCRS